MGLEGAGPGTISSNFSEMGDQPAIGVGRNQSAQQSPLPKGSDIESSGLLAPSLCSQRNPYVTLITFYQGYS